MKVKLNVYYNISKFVEGFRFIDHKTDYENFIFLGEIDIDNPFDAPNQSVCNSEKIKAINTAITSHKAEINVLENKIKDLLSIDYTKEINHEF